MSDDDVGSIPGAPAWVNQFFRRVREDQDLLVERFAGKVRAEVGPLMAQLETAIKQAQGYGTTVGEGMARIEHMERRLAVIEGGLSSTDDEGRRPLAKASARSPHYTTSGRIQVAAVAGAGDHPSTIPAPADDSGGERGSSA